MIFKVFSLVLAMLMTLHHDFVFFQVSNTTICERRSGRNECVGGVLVAFGGEAPLTFAAF